jgi:predicted amidohydrolase YtcJ
MKADAVFKNGNIYTVNSSRDRAEALAILGDKIVFVGTNEDAEEFIGDDTEVKNLGGHMLLPGFIDAHCHPVLSAFFLSGLYIDVEASVSEVVDAISKYVESNPDKNAYFGLGYAEWIFDEKGPKKETLDLISSDKPILILGSSSHEGWCNTKALTMAGIDKDTLDPNPGLQYFERDEKGNPTGHLVEMEPVNTIVDAIKPFNEELIHGKLKEISDEYATMGVTSIVDMGSDVYMEDLGIMLYASMIESGEFKQRVTGCGGYVGERKQRSGKIANISELRKKYDSDQYRISFLKILNDGTIESRSAALTEPYDEDGSLPITLFTQDELIEFCLEAANADLDIVIHAIGDKAARDTIAAAKAVREAGFENTRITNAHCDYVHPDDRPLFGKYGVYANTTTVWHYGNPEMKKVIGNRADNQFTIKSLLDGGTRMPLGSDFPVDEYGREPLKGIEMGVRRQLFDRPDAPVLKPESEKLTLDQCIAGYTIDAAHQNRNEGKLGSIEVGKYADFVILDNDIFEVPIEDVHNIRVHETIIGGKQVYIDESPIIIEDFAKLR